MNVGPAGEQNQPCRRLMDRKRRCRDFRQRLSSVSMIHQGKLWKHRFNHPGAAIFECQLHEQVAGVLVKTPGLPARIRRRRLPMKSGAWLRACDCCDSHSVPLIKNYTSPGFRPTLVHPIAVKTPSLPGYSVPNVWKA